MVEVSRMQNTAISIDCARSAYRVFGLPELSHLSLLSRRVRLPKLLSPPQRLHTSPSMTWRQGVATSLFVRCAFWYGTSRCRREGLQLRSISPAYGSPNSPF